MSRTIRLLAVLLGCGLVLAACDGHSSKSASTSAGGAADVGTLAVPSPSAAASAADAMPTPAAQAGVAGGAASRVASAPQAASAPLQSRAVVSTASMTVQTPHLDKSADLLSATTVRMGGFVDQDDRSDGDAPSAQLVLRVVPSRLAELMADVDKVGNETARTVTADDVTTSVADVGARVGALRTSVARLQALMSTSANLNDLISLESQLTQRQASLDSTVAQQRALADQTSLARLTVNLAPPSVVAAKTLAKKHHVTAFDSAVRGGSHAFALVVRVVLAGVGYALPFLAVLLVLAGLAWLVRWRRRRSAPTASAQ